MLPLMSKHLEVWSLAPSHRLRQGTLWHVAMLVAAASNKHPKDLLGPKSCKEFKSP